MTSELERIAALQKEIPVMFTVSELRGLHRMVDQAHRATVEAGDEQLALKDMEARLASIIEAPLDEDSSEYREFIVSLCPEHLQSAARRLIVYNTGDEHVAMALWCEEDVFERARERKMKITREQARYVVKMLDYKQDASLGISWDTIDCYLDELVLDKEKGKWEEEDDNE